MNNFLYDFLIDKISFNHKHTPSGWIKFNGPCCVHNGERRPDSKQRAGIINHNGILTYNCLNCGFKAGWSSGHMLSKNMKKLLEWLNVSSEEIRDIQFKLFQLKNLTSDEQEKTSSLAKLVTKSFHNVPLPEKSTLISKTVLNTKDFIDVVLYLNSRGEEILTSYDYYYSPLKTLEEDFSRKIIIPFKYQDRIVGWTARSVDTGKKKYYSNCQPNFLFNNEILYDYQRKYVVVVEGPFDAIAIDGVAVLGNKISKGQIEWLKSSKKEIIVLPDRDNKKSHLVDTALENDWYVSFPWNPCGVWETTIKDAADAVKTYGKLFTIKCIMDYKTKNKTSIVTNNKYLLTH